jgi:hypothetical protein
MENVPIFITADNSEAELEKYLKRSWDNLILILVDHKVILNHIIYG